MTKSLSIHSAAGDGEEVNFTCQASGVPAPQFRWSLNGTGNSTTEVEVGSSTIVATSTLVLQSVVVENTGTVTCIAFHENSGNTELVASTGNFIVLSEYT